MTAGTVAAAFINKMREAAASGSNLKLETIQQTLLKLSPAAAIGPGHCRHGGT